jgi:hypothetical protein
VTDPGGDPFARLGLDPATADAAAVRAARRRLAPAAHPDLIGGDGSVMRDLNAAAAAALAELARRARTAPTPAPAPSTRPGQRASRADGAVRRDHPSFTVEVLPVEAFEALVVVASWFGEVVDDSPPYTLDVLLTDPLSAWCRLDLVPDAGATTVSIDVGPGPDDSPMPAVETVRDLWVSALNRLDWSTIA